ncbi:putative motility protein [Paenibacillus sp. GCM10027628]|uniref:putative motility protein n=1 Tax=Paenibacillus sp. GCM10027628 TaxID=3273413 RepID=UPI00363D6DC4
MNVNAALSAINSGDALQQAVGLQLFSKASDMQEAAASTLMQDFTKSQQQVNAAALSAAPHLGKNLDIRI